MNGFASPTFISHPVLQAEPRSPEMTLSSDLKKSSPALVSPHSSPIQRERQLVQPVEDMQPLDLADEGCGNQEEESALDDFVADDASCFPRSGDVVYFEGLKFHYLDHFDLINGGDDPVMNAIYHVSSVTPV